MIDLHEWLDRHDEKTPPTGVFHRDGYDAATDGRSIVAIRVGRNESAESGPKIAGFASPFPPAMRSTVAHLQAWAGEPRRATSAPCSRTETCDECRGTKSHECSCGDEHDCGECGGEGTVRCSECDGEGTVIAHPPIRPGALSVGRYEVAVDMGRLANAILGFADEPVVVSTDGEQLRIHAADWFVVVMGLLNAKPDGAPRLILAEPAEVRA